MDIDTVKAYLSIKPVPLIEIDNPIEIFKKGSIDEILKKIEVQVLSFVPLVDTAANRKDIASLAYKVSQSKVLLDKAGKKLVDDWKNQSKLVDSERKKSRDFLDDLRDKVRQPLTDWEDAEKARIEAEAKVEELREAEEQAYAENEIWQREQEVKEKEAEIARIEAERFEAIQFSEIKRIEIEKAKKEKELQQQREKEIAEQAAEQARLKAEKKAEGIRLEAIKDAEQARLKAEFELEKERNERQVILNHEIAEKKEFERRQRDREHKRKINNEVLLSLIEAGISEESGKKLIRLIVKSTIKHMLIKY